MLSLSSLGIKFPPSSVTLGDSAQGKSSFEENDEEGYNDIFECRSPPALPLQPPPPSQPRHRASFKRFSGRFSLATPQELEPPLYSSPRPKSEDMSMANSVDTENHLYHHHNLKKQQQETADLHKQAIYKSFIETPNFTSWLNMNNSNTASST